MQTKKNIDKENLRQVILDFPKQFAIGLKLANHMKVGKNFKSVCISGMGGSSFPADILETYLAHLRKKDSTKNKSLRIIKNRGYNLPTEANEKCLNIFISYSGNTEETIASLNEAIKNNLPSIGIANGGKLIDICKAKKIPFIIIPDISQPRYALGYFFSVLLQILKNGNLIEKDFSKVILTSIKKLEEVTVKSEVTGKKLAKKLFEKTPLIYTSEKLQGLARVWKIKINENSKTPCFYNYYPELNHNEMVGFTLPQGKFHIVTLIDNNEHPQIIKRMRITANILRKKKINTDLIDIVDNSNAFLTIFSSLALGDWTSYYLALNYKQDPTPVKMVEDFKKAL
jgi:glucose/mannose-6-phosphate isomerase